VHDSETPGLALLLSQLGKRIWRRSDEHQMGIGMRHFFALGFLRSYANLSQHALGEVLCMDANNLVILLNELEAEGYAVRRRDPLDRRRHIVEITPVGRRALARAEKVMEPQEATVLAALSDDERTELRHLLVRALGSPEDVGAAEDQAEPALAQTAP
jgi:DNA-binding MarR family transcriptional regulator